MESAGVGQSGSGNVSLVEDRESSAGPLVRSDTLLLLSALPERRLQTLRVGEFMLGGGFPLQHKCGAGIQLCLAFWQTGFSSNVR